MDSLPLSPVSKPIWEESPVTCIRLLWLFKFKKSQMAKTGGFIFLREVLR